MTSAEGDDATDREKTARNRWATIAELHESGLSTIQIAERMDVTPGAVELALQAYKRNRVTLRD